MPLQKPVVYPADWMFRETLPPLEQFGRRLLAEGDSWFTIGTLNLPESSNVLFKLRFDRAVAVVTCAYPGDTLQHMSDTTSDAFFDRLLRVPNFASFWEAILISAGGNDMIDAAGVPPHVPPGDRLLLTPAEAAGTEPEDYVSDAGWDRLETYLRHNFAELAKRRDEGPSAGRPIFIHTYALPTVRPSGIPGRSSGWLLPSFEAFGIPQAVRQGVSDVLFERLRQLLLDVGRTLPHVHVFDSAGLPDLVPAEPGSTGASGDWVNEIHLSPGGYDKLGRAFGPWMDEVLTHYA